MTPKIISFQGENVFFLSILNLKLEINIGLSVEGCTNFTIFIYIIVMCLYIYILTLQPLLVYYITSCVCLAMMTSNTLFYKIYFNLVTSSLKIHSHEYFHLFDLPWTFEYKQKFVIFGIKLKCTWIKQCRTGPILFHWLFWTDTNIHFENIIWIISGYKVSFHPLR